MIILWIFWNCFFNWLLLFSVSFLVNHLQIFPCLMSNFTEFSPCFKWTAWKSSQLSLSHESINKIIGRCFSGRINNSFTCCFCFSWPSCFVRRVHCAFGTFTFKLLNKLLTFMQNWTIFLWLAALSLFCPQGISPTGQGRPESPVYTNLQELKISQSSLPPVPASSPLHILGDWETHKDSSGRSFYYNRTTQERTWKPPRSRDNGVSRGDTSNTGDMEVTNNWKNVHWKIHVGQLC